MSRLSRGEVVQSIAGALLILISFIPRWGSYTSVSPSGEVLGHGDLDGWGSYGFATNLALLLTLSVILLIASHSIGLDLDPPPRDLAYPVLTLSSAFLLFAALVGGPVVEVPGDGEEHDVTRGPLAYVSLGLAAASVLGARSHLLASRPLGDRSKPDRTTQAADASRGNDGAR